MSNNGSQQVAQILWNSCNILEDPRAALEEFELISADLERIGAAG